MTQHIKKWQEHMPEPREAFQCTMNCSPCNQPCGDCMPYMAHGDPVAARDVEIAELRAALAATTLQPAPQPSDICEGCNGYGMVGNILDSGECPFCRGSGKNHGDLHDAIMQMQMRFGQHVGIGEAPFRDGFEQCRHAAAELVAASEAGNPASVQPIGHVVVWNKGSSREVKRIEPIGKPGVSLARDLPQGALLYESSPQDRFDAQRWRWVKQNGNGEFFDDIGWRDVDKWDAYVDALAAQKEPKP